MINHLRSFEDGLIAIESCFNKDNPKAGILSLKFQSALITVSVTPYDGIVAGIMSQGFGSDHYRLAPEQHWECIEDWIGHMIEWHCLDDDPEVMWFDLYNEPVDPDAPEKITIK